MSTSIQIKHVDEKWLSNMVYISTIDMDDINCFAIMNVAVPGSSHKREMLGNIAYCGENY